MNQSQELKNPEFLRKLRTLSLVEGSSTLILFFIAMPLKYVLELPEAVSWPGRIHGGLFVLLVIYLLFSGLVVGIQGITWSQSGLRQLERGLIHGPHGAISHFERSWDMEDPALNAMSHAALALIHRSFNQEEYENHLKRLERFGGWDSVDPSWIEAINSRLKNHEILDLSEE